MIKLAELFPNVDEVLLSNAPIVAALAQIRFEPILSIQNEASVAPFQEAIRNEYPVLKSEPMQTTTFNAMGGISITQTLNWRFSSLNETWKILLSVDSISIETADYKSRTEFLKKFEQALNALVQHFGSPIVTRTGIRYVNRLNEDKLEQLPLLVKQEFLGILASDLSKTVEASTNEALFQVSPHRLFSRWGLLPPNSTIDPIMIKPQLKSSWVLDIDCSNSSRRGWNQTEVIEEFKNMADTCYRFFRRAVTNDFLNRFGGKV